MGAGLFVMAGLKSFTGGDEFPVAREPAPVGLQQSRDHPAG